MLVVLVIYFEVLVNVLIKYMRDFIFVRLNFSDLSFLGVYRY